MTGQILYFIKLKFYFQKISRIKVKLKSEEFTAEFPFPESVDAFQILVSYRTEGRFTYRESSIATNKS